MKTQGKIVIDGARTFVWMMTRGEVYGWIWNAYRGESELRGWYRTDDPDKAAQIARDQLPASASESAD